MSITTVSSRELNQDLGAAKRASKSGPVIITDRGKPAHVLLSIEDYEQLTAQHVSLVDALALPGLSDIALEPERVALDLNVPDLT
ncbi:Antitoxin [Oceanicaulis sp. 350]|nr:Antitoxin [Oceanicaulis sp. 350]